MIPAVNKKWLFGASVVPRLPVSTVYDFVYRINCDALRARVDSMSKYGLIDVALNYRSHSKFSKFLCEPRPETLEEALLFQDEFVEDDDFVYQEQLAQLKTDNVLFFFYNLLTFTVADLDFVLRCLLTPGDRVFDRQERMQGFRTLCRYYMTTIKGQRFDQAEFDIREHRLRAETFWEGKVYFVMVARHVNLAKFNAAVDQLIFGELHDRILQGYNVQSGFVANLIYYKYGYKYMVDPTSVTKKGHSVWYMFNEDYDRYNPGRIYKWEPLSDVANLTIAVSDLHGQVCTVIAELKVRGKYTKTVERVCKHLIEHLEGLRFSTEVINHMELYCTNKRYLKLLNKPQEIIGVGNGVLDLTGKAPRLLADIHTAPISFSTFNDYKPYDPRDPDIIKCFQIMGDVIQDRDALDYILFNASLACRNEGSEPILLLLVGGGRNGKTTVIKMISHAFGEHVGDEYTYSIPMALLTSNQVNSSAPQSEIMPFTRAIFAFAEESQRGAKLSSERLKQLFGRISARELHSVQANFNSKARVMVATNYPFIIEDLDQGTWRRIRAYYCLTTFSENPIGPDQKLIDNDILERYIKTAACREAMQSILVHYYMRLKNEFACNIHKVPAPTIDRYTAAYRNTQDHLNLFIIQKMLKIKEKGVFKYKVTLNSVISAYLAWRQDNNLPKVTVGASISDDFQMSALKPHIETDKTDNQVYVNNCRVITQTVEEFTSGSISELEVRFA